jgi:hypothetical protein
MRMLLCLGLILTAVALAGCTSSGCCDAGKATASPATYAETATPARPVEVEFNQASRSAPAQRTAGAFPPAAPALPCAAAPVTKPVCKPACKPVCNPLKKLFCDPCCPGGVCGIPEASYR